MKLVVGLGNPGRKYQGTRHNIGFEVVADVARNRSAGTVRSKFQAELTDYADGDQRVILASPMTYMNRSGASVRAIRDFYRIEIEDLLIVCDDLNLPLGRLRFRAQGSAGGQKGLADIIRQLGTEQFARLRVGIGAPDPQWQTKDYVLSRFSDEERAEMDAAVKLASRGVVDWTAHGVQYCMNHYNGS